MNTIVVDSKISVEHGLLPPAVWEQVKSALTFENYEKKVALREKLWNAKDMPDHIRLYEEHRRIGLLPRGFALQLKRGLKAYNLEFEWDDRRVRVPIDTSAWTPIVFGPERQYQEDAVTRILDVQQGMWQAPPGAGKTVGILEAIRRSGQRALIVVNKSNIAKQWVERSEQFLGFTPGIVGDGEFEVKDITVALQQTLWSRSGDFDTSGWWDQFGFVCLDECHHLSARTYTETVSSFPAMIRVGVSGTPDQQEHTMPMMEATLGHVFVKTSRAELVKAGIISSPKVVARKTEFDYEYFPTHDNVPGVDCEVEGCTGSPRSRVHRNNYTKMVEVLAKDTDRNDLIAADVANALVEGRTVMVISKRLAHLEDLKQRAAALLSSDARLITFTGAQKSDERMEIAERAANGNVALFSTIADEALDIPRLDTIVLAWPTANPKITEQQVGRVVRTHSAKLAPVVYDYVDVNVTVLRKQFYKRAKQYYRVEGFEIEGMSDGARRSPWATEQLVFHT